MFALTVAFAVTTPACSTVDAAYDCDQICSRYKECFDANYDAGACASKCRNNAEQQGYADKADACQACEDDRSCAGTFACIDECAGIVP